MTKETWPPLRDLIINYIFAIYNVYDKSLEYNEPCMMPSLNRYHSECLRSTTYNDWVVTHTHVHINKLLQPSAYTWVITKVHPQIYQKKPNYYTVIL